MSKKVYSIIALSPFFGGLMRHSEPDPSHSILGRFYSESFKPLMRHLALWGRIFFVLQLLTYGLYGFYRICPTQEIRIVGPNPAYEPYRRTVRAHELWVWQRNARDNIARNWLREGTNFTLYLKYHYARVLAGELVSERQIPFNYVFLAEGTGTLVPQSNIEEIRGLRSRYLELRGDERQRAQLVIQEFNATGIAQFGNLVTPDPWWVFSGGDFIPELAFLNDTPVAVALLNGDTSSFKNPLPHILPLGPEPQAFARVEYERAVIARRTVPRPMPALLPVAKRVVPYAALASGALLILYHLVKRFRSRQEVRAVNPLGLATYRTSSDVCTCTHCGAVHPRQPPPSVSP